MKFTRIAIVAILCIAMVSALAACTTGLQAKILGRWNEAATGIEFDFQRGGAMTIRVLITLNGTYSFVDADTIQVEFNGAADILGSQTFDVTITGSVMTWTSGGLMLTFNRVGQ